MGIFDKMKEPVFLKESSDAIRQLEVLRELEPKLTPSGQEKLSQDIKNLEYGVQGENQIAFELKNSHIPGSCYCIPLPIADSRLLSLSAVSWVSSQIMIPPRLSFAYSAFCSMAAIPL